MNPRLIRLRDAPTYLGMDINRFNAEVRPHITEIPVGSQGVGFDRLDLDNWFEEYKSRNGRPGKKGAGTWDKNKPHQGSSSGGTSGTSRRPSTDDDYERAREQVRSGRLKSI